jgi:membrane protein DedA with SNARE-associated domain
MSDILAQLQLWIEQIILTLGYPGIALVMAVETIFPPIPSELVMPMAGFLTADGTMNFWGVVLSGTLGSVVGAMVLYWAGLYANETIVRRLVRRYGRYFLIDEHDVNKTLATFTRFGGAAVFIGRLIPLVRSLISIPAGMERMNPVTFVLLTTIGTALWSGILTFTGMVLGQNWNQVVVWISQYQKVVLVVIGLTAIAFVVYKLRTMQRRSVADPVEISTRE